MEQRLMEPREVTNRTLVQIGDLAYKKVSGMRCGLRRGQCSGTTDPECGAPIASAILGYAGSASAGYFLFTTCAVSKLAGLRRVF